MRRWESTPILTKSSGRPKASVVINNIATITGGSGIINTPPIAQEATIATSADEANSYLGWQHFARSPSAAMPQPAPPVPVIASTVQKQNFPLVLTGIGYVTALNWATVRSIVTEPIVTIDFKDGQFVKRGDVLAQLDPSTHQAPLDQAGANLARDQAHLENG